MIWLAVAAHAAPAPVDRAVASGEDLQAWRAMADPAAASEDRPAQLRSFILTFPDSPLAEAAWAELTTVQSPDVAWRAENRRLLDRLERARVAHAAAAAAPTPPTEIEPLPIDDEADAAAPWEVHLHAGGALDGLGPAVGVGVRAGRGPWAGVLRGQVGRDFLVEGVVRLAPPVFGVGFFELGLDTRPRGVTRIGITTEITGALSFESSLGVAVGRVGVQPSVRLELTWDALRGATEPSSSW